MSAPLNLMGSPLPRVDGLAKVTGRARYAAEHTYSNMAHARLVTAAIGRGRVTGIDSAAAEAAGARLVLSHLNADRLAPVKAAYPVGQAQTRYLPLQSDEVRYAGQAVALVVADTPEAADLAASLVGVTYAAEAPQTDLVEHLGRARKAEGGKDIEKGDADAAFDAADIRIDAVYTTATEHHNAIELYSTIAEWIDGRLVVHEPSQWLSGLRAYLAERFGIDQDQVRIISPFVGGGFGSKALSMPHSAFTAMAARRLGRPVKLVVSRPQMFTVGAYRPPSVSRVRLGASKEGLLRSYMHDYTTSSSRSDLSGVPGVESPAVIYACPAIRGRDRFVDLDANHPGPMRAPAEMPSVFALESAMDELAHLVGIDPVELRLKNDAGERDPVSGLPFSSRSLAACWRRGAELFGWSRRPIAPRSLRDGDWLVGWGCAASLYPVYVGPSSVRIRLSGKGRVLVQLAGQDLGTGLYTVVAGAAAETLGVPIEHVRVEMGDSDLPFGSMAAGSRSTASVMPAVLRAAERVRERLFAAATQPDGRLAGLQVERLVIREGRVVSATTENVLSESIEDILKRVPRAAIDETGDFVPAGLATDKLAGIYGGGEGAMGPLVAKHWAMYSFGAQFVEVRVHRLTGTLRVPRAVGVFGAGRIANVRTAHSQLMGGMIWGLSSGLLEATHVDHRYGRYVNANLAEYPIPVSADIGSVQVEMLPEEDRGRDVNPSGMKGVGELGVVGTGAAVANAVFHATGRRVRHLPITIEDVLDGL
ncbi:xanthine dehydrogenase family protein molybdopterin-binding subunit [Variovorax boronicumulans]|uniref:xanthine dehydrogenase family protein molybdopterin-binding subunit n=1 Tax=Variovorax boronicumulans TaxID=436515 RepID=UPI001C57607A